MTKLLLIVALATLLSAATAGMHAVEVISIHTVQSAQY